MPDLPQGKMFVFDEKGDLSIADIPPKQKTQNIFGKIAGVIVGVAEFVVAAATFSIAISTIPVTVGVALVTAVTYGAMEMAAQSINNDSDILIWRNGKLTLNVEAYDWNKILLKAVDPIARNTNSLIQAELLAGPMKKKIIGNINYKNNIEHSNWSTDSSYSAALVTVKINGVDRMIINKQSPYFSNFKFGLNNMKENGCSVIGTYNALVMLGLAKGGNDFIDVIYGMEAFNSALGFFGTAPGGITNYLKSRFITHSSEKYTNDNHTSFIQRTSKGLSKDARAIYILTYWTDKNKISKGAHTIMFFIESDGKVNVFNDKVGSNFVSYSEFAAKQFAKGAPMSIVYVGRNN